MRESVVSPKFARRMGTRSSPMPKFHRVDRKSREFKRRAKIWRRQPIPLNHKQNEGACFGRRPRSTSWRVAGRSPAQRTSKAVLEPTGSGKQVAKRRAETRLDPVEVAEAENAALAGKDLAVSRLLSAQLQAHNPLVPGSNPGGPKREKPRSGAFLVPADRPACSGKQSGKVKSDAVWLDLLPEWPANWLTSFARTTAAGAHVRARPLAVMPAELFPSWRCG